MTDISVFNRRKNQFEVEKVFNQEIMNGLYGTRLGRVISQTITSRKIFNQIYGAYQNLPLSRKKIPDFIQKFEIPAEDFEPGPYQSFNDFFIRRFRQGARSFVGDSYVMPAFCEGRYFGVDKTTLSSRFIVKGRPVSVLDLIANSKWETTFAGGPVLIARLAPIDYHRFHFMDSGHLLEAYRIHGSFHSVNPIALDWKHDILWTNERHVSILETQNFGRLAFIEIGALAVGRIVQTHQGSTFIRGEEKGYFQFGGSTVVVIGEPGRWSPEKTLSENTRNGIETLVELGQEIAMARL